jgi:glycosyltransferase involved in cell wall biosynthesis
MNDSTSSGGRLNVWLVTVGEPLPLSAAENPRLLRTGSLARNLVERGHEVLWWTSAFDHFSKRHFTNADATVDWEGGRIRLLKSTGYRSNVSLQRFVEHAGVARKFTGEAALQARPDVILASLPTIELAHAAVRFGRSAGVPVLLDIRDLWPDLLINVMPRPWRWLSRLVLRGMVRRATQAMSQCQGIVGVSAGYLHWALGYAGRAQGANDAVIPLGYVAPTARRASADVERQLAGLGVRANSKICWYVGTFGRQYDLAPVFKAASALQAAGRSDVQFVISGDGDHGPRWRELAAPLRNVVFTGWIGADEINWLRSRTCIGLQPYIASAPQGLANKLFEYLSAGIPVVSSLAGENEALIARYECGITYRAGDGLDCHRALLRLLDDDALIRRMGDNGRRLFQEQFDASSVFERLITLIETAARSHVPSKALKPDVQ